MKHWSLGQQRQEVEPHLVELGQASCNVDFTHMRTAIPGSLDGWGPCEKVKSDLR